MSYSDFKKADQEFADIFSELSPITKIRDFRDANLNLILSSQHLVGTLKPILEEILGDTIDNKKIILIPNADEKINRTHNSYRYLEQFTMINNMYLKLLDLNRWPKKLILKAFQNSDIISFSGGLTSNLLKSIDALGIRGNIVKILKSGKPFIGFSSGAMCMSETTYLAEQYIGSPDAEIKSLNPLGLVDFEIYPHFEDIILPSVKSMLPKNKKIEAYALRDTEALIITNGELLQAGNPVKL